MRILILVFAVLLLPSLSWAQIPADDDPAEITSDDFGRTRDITADIKSGKNTIFIFNKKKKTPRSEALASRAKAKGTRPKPPSKPAATSSGPEGWEKVGVTLWRLVNESKPATPETARLLTQGDGGTKEWTPKRVAADTVFARGDKVRLSIESPRAGYLYVIDREILADGKLGPPYQIFPTMLSRGGDNRVAPGQMIDIPAQSDEPFTLSSTDPNWRGELLTIIVSPTELTAMPVLAKPSPISASMVDDMEDKYLRDTTEYEQKGTAGQPYTKTEQTAGRDGTRQLTQKDPFPQTVYRVKVRRNEPMWVNLNMSVR